MILDSNRVRGEIRNATATVDIVIVGGGFAGCLAAIALEHAGHRIIHIDIHQAPSSTLFRAEKISGDQLELLQALDLLESFKEVATPVRKFINIRGKRVVDRTNVEEYGLTYPAMIELLRRHLPPYAFRVGRVMEIDPSDDIQRIALTSGEIINARLVVLATGQAEGLCRKLGFVRHATHPQQTVCVGFTIKPPPSGFRFPALTAYGERRGDGVDYLALFPLGDKMRANLFVFSDIRDPRISAIRNQEFHGLFDLLPGLRLWLDGCEWSGETSIFPVELNKYDNVARGGIVLIGDAYRTSCPAVGTGLSCALVDVIRLREHVGNWLKTPGMRSAKIASFYSDPVKVARDTSAQQLALKRRYMHQQSLISYLLLRAHFTKRSLYDRLCRTKRVAF